MKNQKIYFVGGGIVLLAVLIVLSAVLVPMAVHKSEMKELLAKTTDSARLTVGDPLFETGDILGNKGKEVLVQGERLAEIEELLQTLLDDGFGANGTKKMLGGTLDVNLKVKTSGGEIVNLWFTETSFYYMDDETAVLFEAKDKDNYVALYQKIQDAIKNSP